jgi:hypothetical protein
MHVRRAMLLGFALSVAACDVVAFVTDPKPILEQTWNLPADSAEFSVASLLPPGVNIYSTPASTPPDSSAFQVSINSVSFSRRVGDDCAACVAVHGQTTTKPNFVLATGSLANMPTNVVQGTMIGGQVTLQITNGFSFDPLRVKTIAPASTDPNLQGRLVIVIRSGSLVVGRDSLNGVGTALPPGAVLNRTINLLSGNIGGALAVDLTLTSPPSDNNVPINANALMSATMAIPDLRVASMRINVVNRTMSSLAGDSIPLGDLPEAAKKHIVRGGLDMTITNPFNVTGNLGVSFGYGSTPDSVITKTVSITPGAAVRQAVTLDSVEMSNLFGKVDCGLLCEDSFEGPKKVALTVSGTVNSTAPIDVTPKQKVIVVNRLILTVRTPD